jgi:hypothetical protein
MKLQRRIRYAKPYNKWILLNPTLSRWNLQTKTALKGSYT